MPQIQYQQVAQPVPFAPFAEQVTESRWHQPWSEPVRFNRDPQASVALAAASGNYFYPFPYPNSDPSKDTLSWWMMFNEPVRVPARLGAGLNPDLALVKSDPFPETVSYDKYAYPWSEPVRHKPRLHAALNQWQPQNPFGQTQPEQVTESRWHFPWSDPVRTKLGLGAARQQSLQFQLPGNIPESVTFDRWAYPWSEPVRHRPRLGAGLNPSIAQAHAPPYPETTSYDKYAFPWSEPVRHKPRLTTGAQLAFTMQPTPSPFIPWGWFNWLSTPVRVKPDLGASRQSSFTGPPDIDVPVSAPTAWYRPFSEPVRFKPKLLEGLQMSFTMVLAPPAHVNPYRTVINVVIRTRTVSGPGRNSG